MCEHVFDALGPAESRERGDPPPSRLPQRGGGSNVRRARSDGRPFLRDPRPLGAEPGAQAVPDAVPLDDQSISRLYPRVPLLHVGSNARPNGRWSDKAARGCTARRPGLRDGADRSVPPVRRHPGAKSLVDGEAGIPRHPRGRDGAGGKRRPPLFVRSRLEVRDRRRMGTAPASVSNNQQLADGHGSVCITPGGLGRLSTRLFVRLDPR